MRMLFLLAVICSWILPVGVFGINYTVVDLGSATGPWSPNLRINNTGQIVAFGSLWHNGSWVSAGTLPNGQWSRAMGINNQGMVVGLADTGEIDPYSGFSLYHAFSRQIDGTMTDLGTIGAWSWAGRINDNGQAIGRSAIDSYGGPQTVVLWDSGGLHTIDTLSAAGDLDNAGRVVGTANGEAVLWSNGSLTNLGPGSASAINEAGDIVGVLDGPGGSSHAVLWKDGITIDLGYGAANDINLIGQITGWSWIDDGVRRGAQHAVLWQNGSMLDLNSVLPQGSGWILQEAQGINDEGQIVGYGTYNDQLRGFLLNPVPEPSSILALVGGGAGFGFLALRRRRG